MSTGFTKKLSRKISIEQANKLINQALATAESSPDKRDVDTFKTK